ncbi:MAG: hypothetical protein EAZ55_13745 [Cytophagales bacterium]|nr:MAG: hypothetical protein EAZ55_13745 [Cytophagales bacterium]
MKKLYYSLIFSHFFNRYKSLFILLIVVSGTILIDFVVFKNINSAHFAHLNSLLSQSEQLKMEFAPETWLSLLGLVLGTLIVVISIASQSTPKLIDLYINDIKSLFYVWFISIGSLHNVYLQLFFSENSHHTPSYKASILLNTYVMLPIALLLAIPYVIYILLYTKTNNVIWRIYISSLQRIDTIKYINTKKQMDEYQYRLLEALNQLDDLLEYASFKEPKAEIISRMSAIAQYYVRNKNTFPHDFFLMYEKARNDVSFKTMNEQYDEMEASHTFFEQKIFRLFGDAYLRLIERGDFALATLVAAELSKCGKIAAQQQDEALMNVILIRFNTLLRFGIKHGLRNSEARNLYNAIMHYSDFIAYLINTKQEKYVKQSLFYLNIYTKEIYRHSQQDGSFTFLVDVFTYEMQKLLMQLSHTTLPETLQEDVLNAFLQIDDLAASGGEQVAQEKMRLMGGVRVLQVSLGLFYMKEGKEHFVKKIVTDICEDIGMFGKEKLISFVENTCQRLRSATPTFWEDTDRGNGNLYYSENKAQIDAFLTLFRAELPQ